MIALYVDDGLVTATDENEANSFLHELKSEFKIVTKEATYFLGLQLHKKANGEISINQDTYIKKLLERFNMSNCKPVSTPMIHPGVEEGKVTNEVKDINDDGIIPYREAVGALMYLMCGTRPDIAYAVGYVSRYLDKYTYKEWIMVKRIFRYLKGTSDIGIVYKPNYKKGILECYSDADHGGDKLTGRSTTGVLCMYSGGAISWISQRQSSVAISTTEAEIVAASEATREIIWLKRLFKEFIHMDNIPLLQVDNESAVRLAQNPEFHRRTKHIRIRHFFVREHVTEGTIRVQHVATEHQLADVLTKPILTTRFNRILKNIGCTTI